MGTELFKIEQYLRQAVITYGDGTVLYRTLYKEAVASVRKVWKGARLKAVAKVVLPLVEFI